MEGETVLHRTRYHWILFLAPTNLLIIGLILLGAPEPVKFASIVFLAASLITFLFRFIDYVTNEFALTNKRVIFKTGFIRRSSLEILISKIEMISVDQSILGRLLNFGSIVAGGTGGSKNKFGNISNPMELRLSVQKQIDIIQGSSNNKQTSGP